MNKRKIGYEFEKEANEYLKDFFDEVEWLSNGKHSTLDFKCIKDGKEYYGDAKVVSGTKPSLTYNQKDADFVVVKIKGKIEIIFKKDFPEKVNFKDDKNLTTMQIYIEDYKYLNSIMNRRELFRDRIHKIIQEVYKKEIPENEI